jgi:hypothetical protein
MSALIRTAELNAAYAGMIDNDRRRRGRLLRQRLLYKITSAENRRCGYGCIVYADLRAMLRDRIIMMRSAISTSGRVIVTSRPAGDRRRRPGGNHGRGAVLRHQDHA